MRIPFTVADPSAFASLTLRVLYDDGFVAYLNGTEVARRNAPAALAWNSKASSDRPGRLAVVFEQYTNARFQVEKYQRDILPNAEASLKLTNSGYRQGEYGYLSLLTAQRTFFRTNLAYLDALRELRATATTIEGNLLNDSLQAGESSDRDVSLGTGGGGTEAFLESMPELR